MRARSVRLRPRSFFVISMLVLLTSSASAAKPTVNVIAQRPNDPLVRQIVRELEQLDFDVAASSSPSRKAFATVTISESVELQEETPDGSTRTRHLSSKKENALAVAEEVHALLLPLIPSPPVVPAPAPAPAPAPEPPPALPPPPPSPRPKSFEVSAGGGLVLGPADPGAAASVGAAFYPRVLTSDRLSIGFGLNGIVTVIPERISSPAGSTSARAVLVGPEGIARYRFTEHLVGDVGLGAWLTYAHFEGSAAAPFTPQTDEAWTVSPGARLRGQAEFGAWGFFLEGRAGISLPEITIRLGGQDVARWGRPWTLLGAGVSSSF